MGRSAGNRPILAAAWGQREDLPGRTSASLASAIAGGDPQAFYGKGQRQRQGFLFLGAAHGTEIEGTVAALNFLNVLVTGKDLRGKAWPRMAEAGRQAARGDRAVSQHRRPRAVPGVPALHRHASRRLSADHQRPLEGRRTARLAGEQAPSPRPDRPGGRAGQLLQRSRRQPGLRRRHRRHLRAGDAPRWCSSSAASGPIACSARTPTTAAWSNRAAVSSRRISASASSRSARWWAAAASAKG